MSESEANEGASLEMQADPAPFELERKEMPLPHSTIGSIQSPEASCKSDTYATSCSQTGSSPSEGSSVLSPDIDGRTDSESASSPEDNASEDVRGARKRELINRLMEEFHQLFNFNRCATNHAVSNAPSETHPSQGSLPSSQGSSKKQKTGGDNGSNKDGSFYPKRNGDDEDRDIRTKQRLPRHS